MQPALPARPSVPAPAPGRSLSLHPLGAQVVLAPVPATMEPAIAEPNEEPNGHAPSMSQLGPAAKEPNQAALAYAPSPAGRDSSSHSALYPLTRMRPYIHHWIQEEMLFKDFNKYPFTYVLPPKPLQPYLKYLSKYFLGSCSRLSCRLLRGASGCTGCSCYKRQRAGSSPGQGCHISCQRGACSCTCTICSPACTSVRSGFPGTELCTGPASGGLWILRGICSKGSCGARDPVCTCPGRQRVPGRRHACASRSARAQ